LVKTGTENNVTISTPSVRRNFKISLSRLDQVPRNVPALALGVRSLNENSTDVCARCIEIIGGIDSAILQIDVTASAAKSQVANVVPNGCIVDAAICSSIATIHKYMETIVEIIPQGESTVSARTAGKVPMYVHMPTVNISVAVEVGFYDRQIIERRIAGNF
jgi:hypothetical protein